MSMTAEEAAASMSRAFGPCWHHDAAPVALVTGEVVASICEACLERLPASWGCQDCEYVEVRELCQPSSARVMGQPCERHRLG